MTISNQNRVAGPFLGGTGTALPFTFKVFFGTDLQVVRTDPSGNQTVLATGYSVALNADQNVSPGGNVNLSVDPGAGYTTTVVSNLQYLQAIVLTNFGAFLPTVINDAFDRLTIFSQQVLAITTRCVQIPVSDGSLTTTLPTAIVRASKILAFDASGNITISNITLAAIESGSVSAAASAAAALVSATNASASATTATNAAIAASASAAAAAASAAGFNIKGACRVATVANLSATYANGTAGAGATLTNNSTLAAISIDGVALNLGERVLVRQQSTAAQNGIYSVTTVGSGAVAWVLTRATDYDQASEIVEGTATVIEEGTTLVTTMWIMTTNTAITVGTTNITFTQLAGAALTYAANTVLANATASTAAAIGLAIAASQLLGRGPAGNIAAISLNNLITIVGTTLGINGGATGQRIGNSGGTPQWEYDYIPQNSKSAAYTTVLSDAGAHIYHPSADTTARTWTIDSNANVAYPIGTAITFVNDTSAGALTIAITSDTLVLMGAGTTGSRTLAASGIATALKVGATRWVISGTNLT